MWVTNICAELARTKGFNVDMIGLDGKTPTVAHYEKFLADKASAQKAFVYKVHRPIVRQLEKSKFITIFRNPIERTVSEMLFSDRSFHAALDGTKSLVRFYDNFVRTKRGDTLVLFYPEISSDPARVIQRVSEFLEIDATSQQIDQIQNRFSKTRVKSLIKKNDTQLEQKKSSGRSFDGIDIVRPKHTNRIRSFDKETGFQSGHVSNLEKTEYRDRLSRKQISKIEDIFRNLNWEFDILAL